MNCQRCSELLSALFDGELSSGERAECEVHLKSCAECARALRSLQSLSERIRAWPEHGASGPFEVELASRIAASPRQVKRSVFHPISLAACAASFLFGCLLTYGQFSGGSRVSPEEGRKPDIKTDMSPPPIPKDAPTVEVIALAPSIWKWPRREDSAQTPNKAPDEERVDLPPSSWSFKSGLKNTSLWRQKK
jgi:hypothetical protein